MRKINTVLFDLDGTLIDTAPDMANALNLLLEEEHTTKLPFDTIRPEVSNGSAALVKLGFPDENNSATLNRLKKRYLTIYENNLCVNSVLFPGILQLINTLENRQMPWGVITNKPGWLTNSLMQQIGLFKRATCVISGDTTKNRKPHPEPMYLACKQTQSRPENCLYIGDALRDIQAGNNAGMTTVIASYGYIENGENTTEWGADFSINNANEIITLF